MKLNHPQWRQDKRPVDKQCTATNGPGPLAAALNYVQLTRVIFHYYDSILASHNRAGVAGGHRWPLSLYYTVLTFFQATLTAAPMRGAVRDKIVNYNPILWLLKLDRWKGLMLTESVGAISLTFQIKWGYFTMETFKWWLTFACSVYVQLLLYTSFVTNFVIYIVNYIYLLTFISYKK